MTSNRAGKHSELQHFARALQTEGEDPLFCAEAEELLPEYRLAGWHDEQNKPEWEALSQHLKTCPSCAAQYEMLVELETAALTVDNVEPVDFPVPNLALLSGAPQRNDEAQKPQSIPKSEWQWNAKELFVNFTEILQDVVPQFQVAEAGVRRANREPVAQYQFTISEIDEFSVVFTVVEDIDNSNQYMLTVHVDVAEKSAALALTETEVVLKIKETVVDTQLTDGLGDALFRVTKSDLDGLRIEITPDIP